MTTSLGSMVRQAGQAALAHPYLTAAGLTVAAHVTQRHTGALGTGLTIAATGALAYAGTVALGGLLGEQGSVASLFRPNPAPCGCGGSCGARAHRNPGSPPRTIDDPAAAREAVALWQRDGIPGPTGLPRPHVHGGRSPCEPDHPLWGADYREALADADERAATADEGGGDPRRAYVAELRRHPRFGVWATAADHCQRVVLGSGGEARGAGESTARTAYLARAAALASGVDVTSAEYLDTLRPLSRAAALRRQGRAGEAREIERRQRALTR